MTDLVAYCPQVCPSASDWLATTIVPQVTEASNVVPPTACSSVLTPEWVAAMYKASEELPAGPREQP
jgi:hypothetical protein